MPSAYAMENIRRETRHFFECLRYMAKSPELHAEHCQPNRVVGPNGSIYPTLGGPTAPPPPPPVVAPPPPPAAPPASNCGPGYAV